jgi:hypothetical protein
VAETESPHHIAHVWDPIINILHLMNVSLVIIHVLNVMILLVTVLLVLLTELPYQIVSVHLDSTMK